MHEAIFGTSFKVIVRAKVIVCAYIYFVVQQVPTTERMFRLFQFIALWSLFMIVVSTGCFILR